jgi:hypothetical protein
MGIRFGICLGGILFVTALVGCGRDSAPEVAPRGSASDTGAPERLILYSIEGRDFKPGQEPKTEEKFYGYPVLGKVEITEATKRKEIITALHQGMERRWPSVSGPGMPSGL